MTGWTADLFPFAADGVADMLVVNGSRVYALEAAVAVTAGTTVPLPARLGLEAAPFVGDTPPASFPTRGLSLAIAQKCNLGCTYCYAEGGSFGDVPKAMPLEVAEEAVRRLIDETPPASWLR